MDPATLISRCVACVDSFNPSVDTVDVHVERYLGPDPAKAGLPDPDYIFIQQVFYGVNRNDRALRVLINALYHVNAASLNRRDVTLYKVFSYLTVFRLSEMGMRKFTVLLDSQDPAKMHTFLNFVMDDELMTEWVKEGWCKFLDRNYVEDTLLKSLKQVQPEALVWLDSSSTRAFGRHHNQQTHRKGQQQMQQQAGQGAPPHDGVAVAGGGSTLSAATSTSTSKRGPTIPIAPKLTKPKPRTAPEPERIPQGIRAVPVPDWIENTTLEEIEEKQKAIREANHLKAQAKYDFNKTVPKLHETKNTVDKLRAEIEAQRKHEMTPMPPASLPPRLPSKGADVKLNTAAILREDAVYQAKAAKEAAIIRAYEGELRDTSEYFKWKEAEIKKDEETRLAHVAARKREAEAAQIAAAASHASQEAAAKRLVEDMKAVCSLVAEHKRIEIAEDVATKSRTAAVVKSVEYIGPAKAKAGIIAKKRTVHDKVLEASKIAEAAIASQREREAIERAEIIRQIRAVERVPTVHVTTFDPVATANRGLLEEMSLVELRERLVLVRRRDEEQTEEKRREILRTKREHEELMLARVHKIQMMRAQAKSVNEDRKHDKIARRETDAQVAQVKREAAMLELSDVLAERRAARDEARRIMEEEESRRIKASLFLGAATAEAEVHRLASRQEGMERRVRKEQTKALDLHEEERIVAAREARAEEVREAAAAMAAMALDKHKKLAVVAASKEELAVRVADAARKKALFFEATDRGMALQDLRDSLNEYAATMRHTGQELARSARGGIPVAVERGETLTRRVARLPEGHPLAATMSMRVTQAAIAASTSTGGMGGTRG